MRTCKATISFDLQNFFGKEDDRDEKGTVIVYKGDHHKMFLEHVFDGKGASDT